MTIPSTVTAATLSFWLRSDTAESGSTVYDRMRVQVVDGSTVTTLATYSNVGHQHDVRPEVVQRHGLQGQDDLGAVTSTEDSSLQTSFVVDDTALATS